MYGMSATKESGSTTEHFCRNSRSSLREYVRLHVTLGVVRRPLGHSQSDRVSISGHFRLQRARRLCLVLRHEKGQRCLRMQRTTAADRKLSKDFLIHMETVWRLRTLTNRTTSIRDSITIQRFTLTQASSNFFQGCHRSCFQNKLLRECSCGDPRFPMPPGGRHCSAFNATARMFMHKDRELPQTGSCLERHIGSVDDYHHVADHSCKCSQSCRHDVFEVTFSAAKWPSGATDVSETSKLQSLCNK